MKLKLYTLPSRFRFGDGNADFLMLLFFLGVVGGSLFGCFAVSPGTQINFAEGVSSTASFAGTFSGTAFFLVLLCLSATSFLGVFFIPALLAVKAYCVSCSVAVFYASAGFSGLLQAFFTVAVPSVLFLPAFFLCAQNAMCTSGRLYAFHFRTRAYRNADVPLLKTVLFTAVSLLLFALYDYFLMPLALARIF